MEFYASVETAVERRQIPKASKERVDWKEGGAFSASREYLRVKRREHVFDICAAPFGTGFFVSWWLVERLGCLGGLIRKRMTYYRIDTALMFQEAVRAAVNEVIDTLTSAKGLRALTELERKPVLRELVK